MNPNREVFNRVADFYDACRPSPPPSLPGLLIRLARAAMPSRVVDLGAGTGLSTLLWAGQAKEVIGVEPNGDMLAVARQKAGASPSITFRQGTGSATGLPDGCADIVTCAQAFHWMEPESTLAEIARILRPGGVFAAYDYQWPPTVDWRAETAYETFIEGAWALMEQRGLNQGFHQWQENRTLTPLQACGRFDYVKELWLHSQESGDTDRFVGLALSNGVIQHLQDGSLSEDEIGLPAFRQAVAAALGPHPLPWVFSYHVRIGIKIGT